MQERALLENWERTTDPEVVRLVRGLLEKFNARPLGHAHYRMIERNLGQALYDASLCNLTMRRVREAQKDSWKGPVLVNPGTGVVLVYKEGYLCTVRKPAHHEDWEVRYA